jgi:hypothetical protein
VGDAAGIECGMDEIDENGCILQVLGPIQKPKVPSG